MSSMLAHAWARGVTQEIVAVDTCRVLWTHNETKHTTEMRPCDNHPRPVLQALPPPWGPKKTVLHLLVFALSTSACFKYLADDGPSLVALPDITYERDSLSKNK